MATSMPTFLDLVQRPSLSRVEGELSLTCAEAFQVELQSCKVRPNAYSLQVYILPLGLGALDFSPFRPGGMEFL
jgi:hypothetical protein